MVLRVIFHEEHDPVNFLVGENVDKDLYSRFVVSKKQLLLKVGALPTNQMPLVDTVVGQ